MFLSSSCQEENFSPESLVYSLQTRFLSKPMKKLGFLGSVRRDEEPPPQMKKCQRRQRKASLVNAFGIPDVAALGRGRASGEN